MQGPLGSAPADTPIRSSLFARSLDIPDAAHGETVGAGGPVQRPHVARAEEQVARIVVAGVVGRRAPDIALRADVRQGSRRVVAVARSRR